MASNVFFMDLRARYNHSLTEKLVRLINTAGLKAVIKPRDLTAVKLHFGELGNTAFVRPVFVRYIVDEIRELGARPFLTDANTLYAGTRSNAPSHIQTAIRNGFAYAVVNAPLVIADGLRGKSETAVHVGRKHFDQVYIGSEIVAADSYLSVAHFKGHELAGFGGALKNTGMGCASRRGKMAQHATLSPKVKVKRCIGCGDCAERCAHSAITLADKKAAIDPDNCVGCGECILICPQAAIQIQWDSAIPPFLEKMVEYTLGVLQNKTGRCLFVNFLTDISPACDCEPFNDVPMVGDVGIVASTDPVALDQASADLVNAQTALPGGSVSINAGPGADKFKALYPQVEWELQLAYAQELGLGQRTYDLIKL